MGEVFQQIYRIVRQIPCGRVTTYGQVACLLGNPRASRAVGYALRRCGPGIPWHRVVNRDGRCSLEQLDPGGGALQRSLLEQEGVPFTPDGRVDLSQCMWFGEEISPPGGAS